MDLFSMVISIISLCLSVIALVIEYLRDKHLNNINLQSVYFNDIYKEHLIKKIPCARKYISFNNSKLIGTDHLCNEMKQLHQDSLYYYYDDNKFYEQLKECTNRIEDYLIEFQGKTLSLERRVKFETTLQEYLQKLYNVINKKYYNN